MRDDDFLDPFKIMKRFEKMFNESFERGGLNKFKENSREPLVDISEDDTKIKIIVELPGLNKEDIDVRVKNNTIIIKTQNTESKNEEKENTIYKERKYETYYRTIPLPENINKNKINAKYNNGLLELTAPKIKVDFERVKID